MAPLHIAVVSNTAWYLFNFRLSLMHALQAAGHTVVAVAPAGEYADRIRGAGIAFDAVPISGGGVNPLTEIHSVMRLRSLFQRQRVALVLSYTPKGNLYAALASMSVGVPFVPNVSGLGRAFSRRSFVTWIARSLYRLTFPRAHHIFFQNNEDMAVFLSSGLASDARSERLPGSGVDLARFASAKPTGHSADAPVFLLSARMLWDKGVGEFVTAARSVRKIFPNAVFQLLGFLDSDNPSAISREQMRAWTQEGAVTYLGHTDNVLPYIEAADCAVLPSFYREGVPRVLLEAAAMARPIITTDTAGCRDTLIDGVTGLLCLPADADDLTKKILDFLALMPEQRIEMGERARAFVELKFDERIVLNRYLETVAAIAVSLPEKSAGLAAQAACRGRP
ncbi:MAG: glycosyltransferase family 4 protein [Polaromonas sp.]|nr:glycosyltransferase family 4 protein [Polaromonas sp.]